MAQTKKQQVQEIIKCGKDPVYFFNKYVKIQHATRGTLPFNTYVFQDDCVKDFNDHRFNVIVKSRQLGLSTLVAAYAVWLAIFYKDKKKLNFDINTNPSFTRIPIRAIIPRREMTLIGKPCKRCPQATVVKLKGINSKSKIG